MSNLCSRFILFLAGICLGSACFAQSLVPGDYLAPRYRAAEDAPSSMAIAAADEPGDRMVISGQVVDGTVPVAGASIFIFQTDMNGEYAPGVSGPEGELNPRLAGKLRSDDTGHYRVETIRPGSYGGNPEHIHYVVIADGYQPRIFDLWFQDDPLLVERRQAGEPQVQQSMRNSSYYKAAPDLIAIRPVKYDTEGTGHVVRNLDMLPVE